MKINKLIMAGIMAVAVSVLALDNVEIIDVAGRQRYFQMMFGGPPT